jgi:hypothetical protein
MSSRNHRKRRGFKWDRRRRLHGVWSLGGHVENPAPKLSVLRCAHTQVHMNSLQMLDCGSAGGPLETSVPTYLRRLDHGRCHRSGAAYGV